jgi:DNA-directed RNA polymerase specialized sigma24 family protein
MESLNAAQLSDEDLVKLFCANRKDQALATEIWRRYGNVLHDSLKHLIFCRHSFCPDCVDRKTFLDSTFSRTYLNLFARICRCNRLDSQESLQGWLHSVARTAAIDEYRVLTRSRAKIIEFGLAEVAPDEVGEDFHEDIVGEKRPFRSKILSYYHIVQKIPPPDAGVPTEERKFVIREALVRYAQTSDEAAESARAIRLWCWKEWSMAQIGAYFFGDPLTDTERDTRRKTVERELKLDIRKLRQLLAREFGITSPTHI